jgi:hypothetical protein
MGLELQIMDSISGLHCSVLLPWAYWRIKENLQPGDIRFKINVTVEMLNVDSSLSDFKENDLSVIELNAFDNAEGWASTVHWDGLSVNAGRRIVWREVPN